MNNLCEEVVRISSVPGFGCYLSHSMHHDVHVDELWEVEVDLTLIKAEELVGNVLKHSGLLTVEHVGHRHG